MEIFFWVLSVCARWRRDGEEEVTGSHEFLNYFLQWVWKWENGEGRGADFWSVAPLKDVPILLLLCCPPFPSKSLQVEPSLLLRHHFFPRVWISWGGDEACQCLSQSSSSGTGNQPSDQPLQETMNSAPHWHTTQIQFYIFEQHSSLRSSAEWEPKFIDSSCRSSGRSESGNDRLLRNGE